MGIPQLIGVVILKSQKILYVLEKSANIIIGEKERIPAPHSPKHPTTAASFGDTLDTPPTAAFVRTKKSPSERNISTLQICNLRRRSSLLPKYL